MDYRTVQVKLTSPKENIGDLMNVLAITCFKANIPSKWVMMNMQNVLDEQYTQCILKSETKKGGNKPSELS